MSSMSKHLIQFLNRYLSTRIVFCIDMLVSMLASFLMLFLVNLITVKSLLALKPLGIWMMCSFAFSFIFIWAVRTYRIIIRHMTIRALGRFVMVAFCKIMMTGFVFGMVFSFTKVLYLMMIADFFLTSAAFFVLRFAMVVVYDLVKDRLAERKDCHNVLIYGVGDKSVSLISRLQNSHQYRIIGFVQYGKSNVSHVISELPVYYRASED